VTARIHLPLTTPVAAGKRQQDGSAPVGGRFRSLEGLQVLHPQPGACPVQLGGDGTGGRAELGC